MEEKKDSTVLKCPHCGEEINLKVEPSEETKENEKVKEIDSADSMKELHKIMQEG
jgi:hypothetical protein